MRIFLSFIAAAAMAVTCFNSTAQSPVSLPSAVPSPAQPAAPVVPVSTQLQPALHAVQQAVGGIRVDKWKRGTIRDEAAQNISQIQRDIDVTLPPLLREADAAPAMLSKLLPISRNISALYDVLLRVVEASRVIGPDDQVGQLQQALVSLGNARQAFNERMQTAALAAEKQVTDLRATVQMQAAKNAATPLPVAVPCTPPPSRTTKKPFVRKPAAKPPAGTQAKPASGSQQNTSTQQTH